MVWIEGYRACCEYPADQACNCPPSELSRCGCTCHPEGEENGRQHQPALDAAKDYDIETVYLSLISMARLDGELPENDDGAVVQ